MSLGPSDQKIGFEADIADFEKSDIEVEKAKGMNPTRWNPKDESHKDETHKDKSHRDE